MEFIIKEVNLWNTLYIRLVYIGNQFMEYVK